MTYDVVIIGGSLSGAATATLLLRKHPQLRILIIEKSPRFTRRVGEATVEVSGYFLGRVLGLIEFLNESQLLKQGMRFWFANEGTSSLPASSEIGPRYQVRLPSYQVDRSVLDEEVLRRACSAGAKLLRPASVSDIELSPGGQQTVNYREGERRGSVQARWVVDASGVATLLARQQDWRIANDAHPTTAAWGRWTGVKNWDGPELAEKFPAWARVNYGMRSTATNHVVGDGWWSWWIPLKGGDISVGVVFDQRLVDWPQDGGNLGERLKSFLMQHPVARELLSGAQLREGDVHWRKNLAYHSSVFAGDGFVLVGDAAAFLDPLYSPGMDWISFTATRAADLIGVQHGGRDLATEIARHNTDFSRCYHRWFQALYQDKYEYLGEFDLLKIAFQFDLNLYYLGIVSKPYKEGATAFLQPPFCNKSQFAFRLMRTYNRRLAEIARHRRKCGWLGKTNHGQRYLFPSFTLSRSDLRLLLKPLAEWAWLEITEGWRSWRPPSGRPAEKSFPKTIPLAPTGTVNESPR